MREAAIRVRYPKVPKGKAWKDIRPLLMWEIAQIASGYAKLGMYDETLFNYLAVETIKKIQSN